MMTACKSLLWVLFFFVTHSLSIPYPTIPRSVLDPGLPTNVPTMNTNGTTSDRSALPIGVVSTLIAFGSLLVGFIGMLLYRKTQRHESAKGHPTLYLEQGEHHL